MSEIDEQLKKALADLEVEKAKSKELADKVSALESDKHDLEVKNKALHELALHQPTQSANKKLMEDYE